MDTPWSARIRRLEAPAGSGVLIAGDLLITCAHVIVTPPNPEEPPDLERLKGWTAHFETLQETSVYDITGLADGAGWMPSGADIALLRVVPRRGSRTVLPAVSRALEFSFAPYTAVGWPGTSRQQVSIPLQILAPADATVIQADLSNETGYPITAGMSGGAIMTTDAEVVGLLAMRETHSGILSGQVVPLQRFEHPAVSAVLHRASRQVEESIVELERVAVRADHFVGRGEVIAAIERSIEDPQFHAGYIRLEGEPGAGKTAVMAELAATHDWLHHFNRSPIGVTESHQFLKNVCAQMIVRHNLPRTTLPDGYASSSLVLLELAGEAVAFRNARGLGPLVILVDALDEASDPQGEQNRLLLPDHLPDQVFIVASVRKGVATRVNSSQWSTHSIDLGADALASAADLRRWADAFIESHAADLKPRLKAAAVSVDRFATEIVTKADGNFMYLVQILPGVATGIVQVTPSLTELPNGLAAYYERHWRVMRSRDRARFHSVQKPVIAMLATAYEPIRAEQIVEWINRDSAATARVDIDDVNDVLDDWRQFLRVTGGETSRYSVYHATFLEFLAGKINLPATRRRLRTIDDRLIDWE